MEEVWFSGQISGNLKSTFLALIAKKYHLDSYNDFRPISLCNMAYTIISKLIESRIKPILSKVISVEQFGFLEGRNIHEAIGTT